MQLSAVQYDSSGNFNLLYNYFYTENYTGSQATSSYALPITPFYFKAAITGIEDFVSNRRIVWDFDDGTISESITASHVYDTPGRYKVTCYMYDEQGDSYYNIYSVRVTVYDYITDKITLSADTIEHLTGEIKNPITINRFNSARTINQKGLPTINCYASGASVNDYFESDLQSNTYDHLLPYSSFYQTLTSNGVIETIPLSSVQTENSTIFVKLSNSTLVHTSETDTDAIFAGLTGTAEVYFGSDTPGNFNLLFGYDTGAIFDFTNTTTYGISAKIDANTSYDRLTITSNGIDGEGEELSIFNINKNKFANSKIAFVVKVKDDDNFSQKNMPLLSSNAVDLNIILTDGTAVYDANFYSDFGSLSTSDYGGFFKGYFTTNNTSTITNVFLSANTTYNSNFLNGTSSTFNIYPSNYYTLAKKGEDIDFKDTFKAVALQPLFKNSKVLMDSFFGSIFGDISAAQTSIGKATYEKIQNFTDNNIVIDYANIDQLAAIFESIDLPTLTRYNMPLKIKRLVDLLSISHSKLFGSRNISQENFNTFGYLDSSEYGQNLGAPLTRSSVVYKDLDIVAFEKYSGKYLRLNAYLPLSATFSPTVSTIEGALVTIGDNAPYILPSISITTEFPRDLLTELGIPLTIEDQILTDYYALSDYNTTWGWPLLSGGNGDIFDIYEFYYHVPKIDGTITNSILNFNDTNNTLSFNTSSYTEWSQKDGIMTNILANALYEGLRLI
jgi:hypothetical protein